MPYTEGDTAGAAEFGRTTASAPPGAAGEFGETTASAPMGQREGFHSGREIVSAQPAYPDSTIGKGAYAPPPNYANYVNPDQKFNESKEDHRTMNIEPMNVDATHGKMDDLYRDQYREGPRDGAGYMDACRRSPHLKSWTLTLAFGLALILLILVLQGAITIDKSVIIIGVSLTGFVYVLEMFCSSSFSYLSGTHEKEAVKIIVNNMKAATPSIEWHVECYHYETRHHTRRTTDREGHSHTEHYTTEERVNTWTATGFFRYKSFVDASPPLRGLDKFKLTKLQLTKRYSFDNQASATNFQSQRANFREANRRDTHQDFNETFIVPGFKSKLLCEAIKGYKPWCLNLKFYLLFHLFCLGPCYRWWFSSICGNKRSEIVKIFSCA